MKYYFRVKAFKGSYFSGNSNEISALTFPSSIGTPMNSFTRSLMVVPETNAIKVTFNNNYNGQISLSVYTLSGKKITSKEFIKQSFLKEELVSMNGEKGLFIVSLKGGGQTYSKKVLLQ